MSSLLKPEGNERVSIDKGIPSVRKPVGIKTFKQDTSGSRLGFGEVEVRPAPVSR
jgi:hypothetical protein